MFVCAASGQRRESPPPPWMERRSRHSRNKSAVKKTGTSKNWRGGAEVWKGTSCNELFLSLSEVTQWLSADLSLNSKRKIIHSWSCDNTEQLHVTLQRKSNISGWGRGLTIRVRAKIYLVLSLWAVKGIRRSIKERQKKTLTFYFFI